VGPTAGTLTLRTEDPNQLDGTKTEFILIVPTGLYSGLGDVMQALADSAVSQGMSGVTGVDNFTANVLELKANTVTSRVSLTVKTQGMSVLLTGSKSDILTNLLGFDVTQSVGGVLSPQQKGWTLVAGATISQLGPDPTRPDVHNGRHPQAWVLQSRVQFAWSDGGTDYKQQVFIPSHSYTIDGYRAAVNAELAAGRVYGVLAEDPSVKVAPVQVRDGVLPGGAGLRVTLINVTGPYDVYVTMSDTSVTATFPDTTVVFQNNGDVKSYGALNPGTFDKVRSLQISCPGLASGVHVNDESGSSTICRFPINAAPGELIQFDPINPIKNTRDMSGDMLSSFRVQLQDQLAQPIDTAGESYNVVIIIEYDLARGTKTSGGLQ
jgi:hypothetical protein